MGDTGSGPSTVLFAEGSHAQEMDISGPYVNNRGLIKYENGACRLAEAPKTSLAHKALAHIKRGKFLILANKALRKLKG